MSNAWRFTPGTGQRRLHPFQHQALMRGVLVDDDHAVLGLGDDIGAEDLRRGRRPAG